MTRGKFQGGAAGYIYALALHTYTGDHDQLVRNLHGDWTVWFSVSLCTIVKVDIVYAS